MSVTDTHSGTKTRDTIRFQKMEPILVPKSEPNAGLGNWNRFWCRNPNPRYTRFKLSSFLATKIGTDFGTRAWSNF